jgi:hypothetical protein
MWEQYFSSAGWNVHAPVIADSADFLFCFQSPWQMEQLKKYGQTMLFIDSTHNSVANYFLSGGRKISLYTVMVRSAVLGRGLPVAFAFAGLFSCKVCIISFLMTLSIYTSNLL